MTFSSIITGPEYDFAIASEGNDIVSYELIPADQKEVLLLSPGVDAIVLQDGDDTIADDAGSRIYFGNAGNDSLTGNEGADTLVGGRDNDILEGNQDNDVLFGNIGNDTLRGGAGTDIMFGGKNEDVLVGVSGEDILFGDLGDDLLLGGEGNDTLTGGDGSDVFVIDNIGEGIDVITDFSTFQTSGSLSGVDDKVRLPVGVTFESIVLQDTGTSQTSIVLASSGQTLAILQNISSSAITSANFTTTDVVTP